MNKNRIRLAVLAALMFGLCCAASAADKERALVAAAIDNDVAKAQRLIAEGVDVNARGRYSGDYNPTVLMVAANSNFVDVAKVLIAAGADVNAWANDGKTALIIAAKKKYVAMVKLLIEAGANVNAKDGYGRTALIYATYYYDKADVAKLLIEAGADVNVKDVYGHTARYYVPGPDVRELLEAAGAR